MGEQAREGESERKTTEILKAGKSGEEREKERKGEGENERMPQ